MMSSRLIPSWLKVLSLLFLAVLIPVYWIELGISNFLWFSDIALIITVIAMYLEKPYPISMMAVAVLMFELIWNLDFFSRLFLGVHFFGIHFTEKFFTNELSLLVRTLSISFHVLLPILLLYLLSRLGYEKNAWKSQTIFGWLVLIVCYIFTDPADNINLVYGFYEGQTWLTGVEFLVFELIILPLIFYLPTHWLLSRVFLKAK